MDTLEQLQALEDACIEADFDGALRDHMLKWFPAYDLVACLEDFCRDYEIEVPYEL